VDIEASKPASSTPIRYNLVADDLSQDVAIIGQKSHIKNEAVIKYLKRNNSAHYVKRQHCVRGCATEKSP